MLPWCRVEQVHKLHDEGRGRHLLRVLIEQNENIALVVRDEGQFESQHGGATAKDEEGGKNQRTQHFKRRDPPRRVAVEESPGALLWFDLKVGTTRLYSCLGLRCLKSSHQSMGDLVQPIWWHWHHSHPTRLILLCMVRVGGMAG